MSSTPTPQAAPGKSRVYQIRLKGHLDESWVAWFGGLTIVPDDDGETVLTGAVADQAALYGLLRKVRDCGLTLLAVNCVEPDKEN